MSNAIADTMSRPQPHNLEAERSVLGAILLHPDLYSHAADVLAPDDFWRAGHRLIYQAVVELAAAHAPIDMLTVRDALTRKNDLDAAGGPAYLMGMTDGIPRAINVGHYARMVKDSATRRAVIAAAGEVIESAYSTPPDVAASEIVTDAQSKMFALRQGAHAGGLTPMTTIVSDGMNTLQRLADHKGGISGVPTGFVDLDALLCGMQPTDLIVVGGRPSMGKTAFGLNVAQHVGIGGRSTAVFSLEMSKDQLFLRMLASEARVDLQKMRSGYLGERDYGRMAQAMGVLSAAPIYIDDQAALTVADVAARCRRLAAEQGLDFVLIDYLQLMRGPKVGKRYESRQIEVSGISSDLKALAKELRVPIMVLSQLSRAPEARAGHKPQMSDLRDSGSLEQDADVILFPYRAEQYADHGGDAMDEARNDGMAELIIAKQRNGPTDTIKLAYIKPYTRFENLATDDPSGRVNAA